MSKRILDRLHDFTEKEEEITDNIEETVSQALEESKVSVAEISDVSGSSARIKLDLSDVIKEMYDYREFDKIEIIQERSAEIKIKEEYKPDGEQEGN